MLTARLKSNFCTKRVLGTSFMIFLVLLFLGSVNKAKTSTVNVTSVNEEKQNEYDEDVVPQPDDTENVGAESSTVLTSAPTSAKQNSKEDIPKINRKGRVNAKTIADGMIAELLKRIGSGRGPFIVGGIGDSGTRGVRDVMNHFGAQMLGEGYIHPISKDSEIYMDTYQTTQSDGRPRLRAPPGLYNLPISLAHSLKYNSSIVDFDQWQCGRQWVAIMVNKSMAVSESYRAGAKLDPWGFKHPRTALLLPFWLSTLGEKFVFIHVIRDGKDIIEGDNQKLFRTACQKYYGRRCQGTLTDRIDFWADLNRDIFEFALESDMKADQYFPIRIEDLALGNEPCYRRLAQYMNLGPNALASRVPKAIAANRGHESSYLGNKWSPEIKAEVENATAANPHTLNDFKFWGYKSDAYELALDCESLPWMNLMRAKKGPLPGDGTKAFTKTLSSPNDG